MTSLLQDISVNGTAIPAARIAAEAQNHPAPKGKPGIAWRSAARALALREALLQEARSRGLTPAPEELSPGRWETDEEALIRQLLELAIAPEPVSEASLEQVYAAAPDRFRSPPLWEVSHILFAGDEDARSAAEKALAALRDRPDRWGDLAQSCSACSSREHAGKLGQIGPGDTVAPFEAALRAMAVGQISGPVRTPYGWHLIRLDAAAPGKPLPFTAVLPRLRVAAEQAAWSRAAREFVERVLRQATVTGISFDRA